MAEGALGCLVPTAGGRLLHNVGAPSAQQVLAWSERPRKQCRAVDLRNLLQWRVRSCILLEYGSGRMCSQVKEHHTRVIRMQRIPRIERRLRVWLGRCRRLLQPHCLHEIWRRVVEGLNFTVGLCFVVRLGFGRRGRVLRGDSSRRHLLFPRRTGRGW